MIENIIELLKLETYTLDPFIRIAKGRYEYKTRWERIKDFFFISKLYIINKVRLKRMLKNERN